MTKEEMKELGLCHVDNYMYSSTQENLRSAINYAEMAIDRTMRYMILKQNPNFVFNLDDSFKTSESYIEDAKLLLDAAYNEKVPYDKDFRLSLSQELRRTETRLGYLREIESLMNKKEELAVA